MSYAIVGQENGANAYRDYNDWREGQTVIFSRGSPMSAHPSDDQMLFIALNGPFP